MSRGLENLRLIDSSCINAKGRLENFRLAGLENLRLIGSSCINAKGRLENFRLAGSSYLYVKRSLYNCKSSSSIEVDVTALRDVHLNEDKQTHSSGNAVLKLLFIH
jgi:hypothetical protein